WRTSPIPRTTPSGSSLKRSTYPSVSASLASRNRLRERDGWRGVGLRGPGRRSPRREADASRIPPLVELPKLLAAAERIVDENETDEDLRLLFAPGSSLGGARPKASVRLKDGSLAIAKFPRRDDEINVVVWEAVALT